MRYCVVNGLNPVFIKPSSYGLLVNNLSHVSPSNKDILLSNGVVQPIDTVLIPDNIPSFTISQVLLTQDGEFGDLFLALILANLTDVLDSKLSSLLVHHHHHHLIIIIIIRSIIIIIIILLFLLLLRNHYNLYM